MRVLLIKTSSMGDIIHTFPALTDAKKAVPNIEFDWLVEESFADIPVWHPAVREVKKVAIRRWRKNVFKAWRQGEYCQLRNWIKQQNYDLIIDAQSLFKSAWLTCALPITTAGLASDSARDPFASVFFDKKYHVDKTLHAVERTRLLLSQALAYKKPATVGDYGLDKILIAKAAPQQFKQPYSVFLHGTTWPSKHWPEQEWRKLAEYFNAQGQPVLLPWGNKIERERAQSLAQDLERVQVLDKMTVTQLAAIIVQAKSCVAVDTGLGHLTAALDVPCISLYGPTLPKEIGAYGKGQIHLCDQGQFAGSKKKNVVGFETLNAEQVIQTLEQYQMIGSRHS